MMHDDKELEILTQEIKALRRTVFKAVDNAIGNILRCCVNLSPEAVEQVIANVLKFPAARVAEKAAPATIAPAEKEPTVKKRRGRKAVWANSSDQSLRGAYSKRKREGKEIEPELQAELARRFPTYDCATNTFTGGSRGKKAAAAPSPYRDLSNNDIMLKYHAARMAGTPIEDDLHAELKRRYYRRYDAVNRVLPDKKKTGSKKKALSELTDSSLKTAYYKAGGKISGELNAELARRFPAYDARTRTFIRLGRGERFATTEEIKEIEARERRIALAKMAKPVSKPAPEQITVLEGQLNVTMRRTKIGLDGAFYDVYVNGKRILHNHINTQLHTFLNGTILGVYGTATDIANLPTKQSWQIYDTRMSRRTFTQTNPITKKNVYITGVHTLGDDKLVLDVSNKMRVQLDYKPSDIVFKILSENQNQK